MCPGDQAADLVGQEMGKPRGVSGVAQHRSVIGTNSVPES